MKKKFALLFFSVCLSFQVASQATVSLASDVWPPFTNTENEQAVALALVKEALSRAFVSSEFHILDFEEVMSGIAQGSFDGSGALWKTPEREKALIFSQPYMQNQLVLVGKSGADVSASELRELSGRIAIVSSYAYGDILSGATNATFVQGTNAQENLDKLLNNEVDYMLVDRLLIQYMINYKTKEVDEFLAVGKNVLLIKPLHFALRKDFPNAEEIMQRFNQEIVKMSADGTYNKILNLNWIATDIDGDGRMEYVLLGNQGGDSAPINSYSVWFEQESPPEADSATEYYVEGRLYNSWREVPEKYKQPVVQSGDGDFNLLRFKID